MQCLIYKTLCVVGSRINGGRRPVCIMQISNFTMLSTMMAVFYSNKPEDGGIPA